MDESVHNSKDDFSKNNSRVKAILDKVYNFWTDIRKDKQGKTIRVPKSFEEVDQSIEELDKIKHISYNDTELEKRIDYYFDLLEAFIDFNSDDSEEVHIDHKDEDAEEYEPEEKENNDNIKAIRILEDIYDSWTSITEENEEQYKSPDSRGQIRKSRKLLNQIEKLNVTHPSVKENYKEIVSVVDFADKAIPNYTGRVIAAILGSVAVLGLLFYLYTIQTSFLPDFEYEEDLFAVTEKGGELKWADYDKDTKFNHSLKLKPGTKVKPIARNNSYIFQAELDNGQRGFVKNSDLVVSQYVLAKKDAFVFKEFESGKSELLPSGTEAVVVDRLKKKNGLLYDWYYRLQLDDGRLVWGRDTKFKIRKLGNMPIINRDFKYTMNRAAADTNFIGQQLEYIESKCGLALFVDKTGGNTKAYFTHLDLVDDGTHYGIVVVDFDNNGLAKTIDYKGNGRTRWFDALPLVDKARALEPNKLMNFMQYDKNRFKPNWWVDFSHKNSTSAIVAAVVDFIVHLILLYIFFCLPLIIIAPITQLFSYTRILPNGAVVFIFILLMTPVLYAFFVLLVYIEHGFILASIAFLVMWGHHFLHYNKKINYHRCPNCKTMYSAADEGTTYSGKTQSVSWGTWDKYKNTTKRSGMNTDHIIHNYERRDKKTTKTFQHYEDHRSCLRCGHAWEIKWEKETGESTNYY